ncbi:MAG: potassium channel family protein [Pseudomonadota bacterium]
MLIWPLIVGSVIVLTTACFHVSALVALVMGLRRIVQRHPDGPGISHKIFMLSITVVVVLAIHSVEVWSWAVIYLLLGEFESLNAALYFSGATITTLGYGDITLSETWRLLSTFEAMSGLILFGASTAFMIDLTRRLFDNKL